MTAVRGIVLSVLSYGARESSTARCLFQGRNTSRGPSCPCRCADLLGIVSLLCRHPAECGLSFCLAPPSCLYVRCTDFSTHQYQKYFMITQSRFCSGCIAHVAAPKKCVTVPAVLFPVLKGAVPGAVVELNLQGLLVRLSKSTQLW